MVRGCLPMLTFTMLGYKFPAFINPPPPQPRKLLLCLTTDPQPLPMRVLQRVRASFSSFHSQDLIVSLRSSRSCLRLLPRLLAPSIFSTRTYIRRQFVR
jgi:hypothetical protein